MRKFSISLFVVAALLVAAIPSVAGAQTPPPDTAIPAPSPVLIHLGRTPVVELFDGGGGLPYLGSPTSLQRGRLGAGAAHLPRPGVYRTPSWTQIDKLAEKAVLRSVHKSDFRSHKGRFHKGHGRARAAHFHGKKLALVLDIDETSLSNYDAIQKDNFTFGTNSQAEATAETGVKIPSTLELFNLAKQNGVAVFFITGRREQHAGPHREQPHARGLRGLAAAVPQAGRVDRHHRAVQERRAGGHRGSGLPQSSPTSATSTQTWPEATRTSGSSSPTRSTSCHRLAAWPATSTCSTPLSVRDFVAGVRAAIEDAGSPAQACDAIRPAFAELLADPDWLPERFQEGDPDSGMGGGIGQWLLFRAGDRSLSLFALVVPPARRRRCTTISPGASSASTAGPRTRTSTPSATTASSSSRAGHWRPATSTP